MNTVKYRGGASKSKPYSLLDHYKHHSSTLGTGAIITAGTTGYSMSTILEHQKCLYWAEKLHNGLGPFLTPEQIKWARLYSDQHYWGVKLAKIHWFFYGIPAIANTPEFLHRLGSDIQGSFEYLHHIRHFSEGRKKVKTAWSRSYGVKLLNNDKKVLALLATITCFIIAALIVATGGLASISFAALLNSSLFGAGWGIFFGGVYGGIIGQNISHFFLGIYNKFSSRIAAKHLDDLEKSNQKAKLAEYCKILAIKYTGWTWFDKLRIRLKTGSSELEEKAWILRDGDYTIVRKHHNYRTIFSLSLMSIGIILGGVFLGVVGAVVLGYIGYLIGDSFAQKFLSFHNPPSNYNDRTNELTIRLYERLERIKYRLDKLHPFKLLFNYYYKKTYLQLLNKRSQTYLKVLSALGAIVLGSAKIMLNSIILPFLSWKKNIVILYQDFKFRIKMDFKIIDVLKKLPRLLSLPLAIVDVLLFILNPFSASLLHKRKRNLLTQQHFLESQLEQLSRLENPGLDHESKPIAVNHEAISALETNFQQYCIYRHYKRTKHNQEYKYCDQTLHSKTKKLKEKWGLA